MRCWWKEVSPTLGAGKNTWKKGSILKNNNNTKLLVDGNNNDGIILQNADFQFAQDELRIAGYEPQNLQTNEFKFVTVHVRFKNPEHKDK